MKFLIKNSFKSRHFCGNQKDRCEMINMKFLIENKILNRVISIKNEKFMQDPYKNISLHPILR